MGKKGLSMLTLLLTATIATLATQQQPVLNLEPELTQVITNINARIPQQDVPQSLQTLAKNLQNNENIPFAVVFSGVEEAIELLKEHKSSFGDEFHAVALKTLEHFIDHFEDASISTEASKSCFSNRNFSNCASCQTSSCPTSSCPAPYPSFGCCPSSCGPTQIAGAFTVTQGMISNIPINSTYIVNRLSATQYSIVFTIPFSSNVSVVVSGTQPPGAPSMTCTTILGTPPTQYAYQIEPFVELGTVTPSSFIVDIPDTTTACLSNYTLYFIVLPIS